MYQQVKDRANRMQSESSLSNFAEVQPIFEAKLQWTLAKLDLSVLRFASANVEFYYSTEKKSSVEFSVERPKTAYNTCVYRSFRKNKKNSTEIPVELQ